MASKSIENCHCRQRRCRLTHPVQGTPQISAQAYIARNYVTGLHFCAESMGLSTFTFVWWALKKNVFETDRVIAVQGHPRSLILAPIESAYSTSYYSLTETLVLSCTVSEIRRLIGQKLRIIPIPLSFNALAPDEPFRIFG